MRVEAEDQGPSLDRLVHDLKQFGRVSMTADSIGRAPLLCEYLGGANAGETLATFKTLLNGMDQRDQRVIAARALLGVDHPYADVTSRLRIVQAEFDGVEGRTVRRWAYDGYSLIARELAISFDRPFAHMFIRVELVDIGERPTLKVRCHVDHNVQMETPAIKYVDWTIWQPGSDDNEAAFKDELLDMSGLELELPGVLAPANLREDVRANGSRFIVDWLGDVVPTYSVQAFGFGKWGGVTTSTWGYSVQVECVATGGRYDFGEIIKGIAQQ